MELKEAYKVMQAAWVDLYDVKVGDAMRVLRDMKEDELGCVGGRCHLPDNATKIVRRIGPDHIVFDGGYWPFFCLEKIKDAPHTIAFDGQDPIEISDKSYEALKGALR